MVYSDTFSKDVIAPAIKDLNPRSFKTLDVAFASEDTRRSLSSNAFVGGGNDNLFVSLIAGVIVFSTK